LREFVEEAEQAEVEALERHHRSPTDCVAPM
jgi:hypothetical protein